MFFLFFVFHKQTPCQQLNYYPYFSLYFLSVSETFSALFPVFSLLLYLSPFPRKFIVVVNKKTIEGTARLTLFPLFVNILSDAVYSLSTAPILLCAPLTFPHSSVLKSTPSMTPSVLTDLSKSASVPFFNLSTGEKPQSQLKMYLKASANFR